MTLEKIDDTTMALHDCATRSRSASSALRKFSTNHRMPGAINMGLADGHAELVTLEDLWKCY